MRAAARALHNEAPAPVPYPGPRHLAPGCRRAPAQATNPRSRTTRARYSTATAGISRTHPARYAPQTRSTVPPDSLFGDGEMVHRECFHRGSHRAPSNCTHRGSIENRPSMGNSPKETMRVRSRSATGRPGPDRVLSQLRISTAGEPLQNGASEVWCRPSAHISVTVPPRAPAGESTRAIASRAVLIRFHVPCAMQRNFAILSNIAIGFDRRSLHVPNPI